MSEPLLSPMFHESLFKEMLISSCNCLLLRPREVTLYPNHLTSPQKTESGNDIDSIEGNFVEYATFSLRNHAQDKFIIVVISDDKLD